MQDGYYFPPAVKFIKKPANRHERRLMTKEAIRNAEKLDQIRRDFFLKVHNPQNQTPYSKLYNEYKALWDEQVGWLKANKKLKTTVVVDTNFYDLFDPKEEDLTPSSFSKKQSKLFQWIRTRLS